MMKSKLSTVRLEQYTHTYMHISVGRFELENCCMHIHNILGCNFAKSWAARARLPPFGCKLAPAQLGCNKVTCLEIFHT